MLKFFSCFFFQDSTPRDRKGSTSGQSSEEIIRDLRQQLKYVLLSNYLPFPTYYNYSLNMFISQVVLYLLLILAAILVILRLYLSK